MHPRSRREGILTTPLPGGEVVLYDASAESYRQLSSTCAYVWESCDGATSVEAIAAGVQTQFGVESAEDLVEEALRELTASDLVDRPAQGVAEIGVTRRTMLRRGAVVAMVPLVTTLAMPRFASATTAGIGSPVDDGEPGGCTPGYWKNHLDRWVGYTTTQLYNVVFGVNQHVGKTLLEVLNQGGGGWNALGRHSTAALLNAAHTDIDYDLTVAGIIADVQAAAAGTKDVETLATFLDYINNAYACPLGGTPAMKG